MLNNFTTEAFRIVIFFSSCYSKELLTTNFLKRKKKTIKDANSFLGKILTILFSRTDFSKYQSPP